MGGLGVSGWNSAENDGDGGGGLVVVAAYTGLAAHRYRTAARSSRRAWPRRTPCRPDIRGGPGRRVIVKAWGGGAVLELVEASRRKSVAGDQSQTDYIQRDRFWGRGGGGGFARASLSVTPGDALEILVGGGGGAVHRRANPVLVAGMAARWRRGRVGRRRRRACLVKLNGQTMLVAGGGGGGGGGATD